MMNKIFTASLLCATALSLAGCAGEEADIFSSSAAERLEETKDIYTERMASSEYGWVMEYYPTNGTEGVSGSGYLILAGLKADGEVRMGMNNVFSGNTYIEDNSAWEVIADNGPVLTFNTYNRCIHAFCDPAGNDELGTAVGRGAEGDYEFVMIDVPEDGDYVMLKGKKRGTYIRLTRLENDNYEAYLDSVQTFSARIFPASAPNTCMITLGDSTLRMADGSTGIANLYPYDGDAITDENLHPYLITRHRGEYYLRFRDELTAPDGQTAQEFRYDAAQDLFVCTGNPDFTLAGDIPARFFINTMSDGNTWRLSRGSEMSDDIYTLYENIRTGFSSIRYTFNYVSFGYSEGRITCSVNYRTDRNSNVSATYLYDTGHDDSGCTLGSWQDANETATNTRNSISAINDLLNALTGNFTVTAGSSRFNMQTVRLTADNGKTIVLTHYNQ